MQSFINSWTSISFSLCFFFIVGNIDRIQGEVCGERQLNRGNRVCSADCRSDIDCKRGETCRCDGECGKSCVREGWYGGGGGGGGDCDDDDDDIDCKRGESCRCDGECGKSCVREDMRCYPNPSIIHGSVDVNPYNQFGAIAKYICDEGYKIVGLSIRICQGDGKWKGENPRCEQNHDFSHKKDFCGPPPEVPHATHTAPPHDVRFKPGTHIHYSCDAGYIQDAVVNNAWCVRGSQWMGPIIKCESRGCPAPNGIENGRVQTMGHLVGDKAYYVCKSGYFLVGPSNYNYTTCQSNGAWDRTGFQCERVVCGPPPMVEHAQHDGPLDRYRFSTGIQLLYTCQDGYFRNGSNRAICAGPAGQWKGPEMSCRARDCGAPGEIANGHRDQGYRFTYPTRLTYYCNDGYEMKGGPYRECMANGEWSGNLPHCEPIRCDDLAPPLHGTRIGSKTTFGSVIRFVCNNGFKVVGSAVRSCQSDGSWSGQKAECKEINCGLPGPIWNGYLDGHRTTVGAVYFYRCDLRTKFNGTTFSTQCLENGQWSNPVPKCLGQCQVPAIFKGTILVAREGVYVDHGTVIEPKCFNGNVINDSRPVTCNNGTWTIIPRCVPAPCNSSPPQLENGHRVFFSLSHGAKARYFCFAGYKLVDKVTYLHCEFGKWVGTRPQCEEQFCPHPGNLKNGHILKIGVKGMFPFSEYIYTIRHGERLIYECNRDHRLSGPRGAACVNGKWSPQEQPKCLRSRHPVFNKLWRPFEENHRHPQYY